MHCEPRRVRILLAEDPSSFQKRPTLWHWFERVENREYVTWIRRLNPVHNIWIVSNRLSSRYLVRGFGFCDLDSPDLFRTAIGTVRRWVRRLVRMGGVSIGVDAIRPMMVTNLFQRLVELMLVLPLNVWPFVFAISLQLRSNQDGVGYYARDGWKSAAADDHNHYDYA